MPKPTNPRAKGKLERVETTENPARVNTLKQAVAAIPEEAFGKPNGKVPRLTVNIISINGENLQDGALSALIQTIGGLGAR